MSRNFVLLLCMLIPALCLAQNVKRITSVNDSYPAPSPDGTIMLFQSDRSGDTEIWSMNADGSQLKKLTSSQGYDGNPSWSPDGKQIAFTSRRDKDLEIYIMKSDGSGQQRLTQTRGNDGHPHWYPDGSRIIFNSARTSPDLKSNFYDEIFSMKPDGSDVKQLTELKSVSTYASISPDGNKIVFRGSTSTLNFGWDMSVNAEELNSEIFVMDLDGKNLLNLTKSPAFDGWPWWSPDSKKIVFASNRSGQPNSGQLYTVNIDGTGLSQLTDLPGAVAQPGWSADGKYIFAYQLWETPVEQYGYVVRLSIDSFSPEVVTKGVALPVTAVMDSYPAMSPDGKSIAFHSNRTGDEEIFIVDSDGKHLRQITFKPAQDGSPVWSPDGKQLAFSSERDGNGEIYIMNADGTGEKRLTNTPGGDSHPHWFPDGSRIMFNSARNTPDLSKEWSLQFHDVYSMKPDGTDVKRHTDHKTVSTYPSVSPDGKFILHRKVLDTPAYNWDLTLNARGRNSEAFITSFDGKTSINLSVSPSYDGWPAWSPDGSKIVFVSNRNGKAGGGQLFLINPDGTGLRQLTKLAGAIVQPSWAPDSKSIVAYQSFETAGVEYGNIILIPVE